MKTALAASFIIGATWKGERAVADVGKSVDSLKKKIGDVRAFKQQGKAVLELKREQTELHRRLAVVGREMRKTKNPTEKLAKEFADLKNQSDRKGRALDRSRDKLRKMGSALHEAGFDTKRLTSEQKKLENQLRRTQNQSKASGAIGELGNFKGAALGAVGTVLGGAATLGGSVERQFQAAHLGTVFSGPDRDQQIQQARKAASLSAGGGLIGYEQALEVQYQLGSAGLSGELSRAAVDSIAHVSAITRGSAEEVANTSATIFNRFGSQLAGDAQARMTYIGDLLAKTQTKFQIKDFHQLSESFKNVAAAASESGFNINLEQTFASLGALNDVLPGGQAGTGITAVMRNMSKAADEWGTQVVFNDNGTLDFLQSLELMKESLEGMDALERNDEIQRVFGDEGAKALRPLFADMGKLTGAVAEFANVSGFAARESSALAETNKARFKSLRESFRQVGDALAGSVLPGLVLVGGALEAFLSPIARLAESVPFVFEFGGAFVAAGVGAFYAVKFLTMAKAAVVALNAVLLANPIALVVGAVAGAAFVIYKNWKPIKKFFKNLWAKIWGGAKAVFSWISSKFKIVGKIARLFGLAKDAETAPARVASSSRRRGRSVPGLRETGSGSNAVSDMRQDNRQNTFNITSNNPEEVARAVEGIVNAPADYYDVPLADGLNY